jgi:hypothetical protein
MTMDRVKRTSGTPTFPISLAVMKDYLAVNHSLSDTIITNMCNAALGLFERLTRRAIVEAEFTLTLDRVPGGGLGWWDGVKDGAWVQETHDSINIPYPPLITVDEVRTTDLDNTSTVFSADNYWVDTSDMLQCGRLVLNYGKIWPANLRPRNAMAIDFTAGYVVDTIPGEILEALKMMVSWVWSKRGGCDEQGCKDCGAYGMLQPFILFNMGLR